MALGWIPQVLETQEFEFRADTYLNIGKFGTFHITGITPYSVKLKVDFRKLPEASAGNCLCLLAKTFLIYLLEWQSSGGPQSRILGALSKSNYLLILIADEIVFTAPIG